jgi:hypothetical protein
LAKITNFRLSLIWVETIPAILAHELPAVAPLACLGQIGDYAKLFESLRSFPQSEESKIDDLIKEVFGPRPKLGSFPRSDEKADGFADLSLPWPKRTGNHFWKFYFEGRQAGEITGIQAWKKLVPLRKPFHCKHVATASNERAIRVSFETFYGPHGTALVANVYYRGNGKSLIDIATLAHDVRWNHRFSFGDSDKALSLDSFGEQALAKIRQDAFGAVEGFLGHNQPFTIASFISGIEIPKNPVIKQGSVGHRSLEALTGWNRHFRDLDLSTTPLSDAVVRANAALTSDLIYARKNARAIWFPRALDPSQTRPNPPSLMSCYHRNLVLATLLTLGMGEFVAWVATQHQLRRTISPINYDRAKRVASLLRMLLEGKKEATYRSMSIARTIEAADWPKQMALITGV